MLVVELLTTGHFELCENWDDAWIYAKRMNGGNAEGNVRVHEVGLFDPSTWFSEYDVGVPSTLTLGQKQHLEKRVMGYWKAKRG